VICIKDGEPCTLSDAGHGAGRCENAWKESGDEKSATRNDGIRPADHEEIPAPRFALVQDHQLQPPRRPRLPRALPRHRRAAEHPRIEGEGEFCRCRHAAIPAKLGDMLISEIAELHGVRAITMRIIVTIARP
jgi:hypothetical protein